MMNRFTGVFSRFRKEETAVTCDIEQMLHSFYVNPEKRDLLRFLCSKDNDLAGQTMEYCMNVHLFGAISVIKSTQAMCAEVNLRLHKFASNSKVVLVALPTEDRSKDLKDLDLHHDTLPVKRSLDTEYRGR